MAKVLVSDKYCLYIGRDVFEVEVFAKNFGKYKIPCALIGKGIFLLINADKVGLNGVEYVALAQVPRSIIGDISKPDWKHGFRRYKEKLEELGLSLKDVS